MGGGGLVTDDSWENNVLHQCASNTEMYHWIAQSKKKIVIYEYCWIFTDTNNGCENSR